MADLKNKPPDNTSRVFKTGQVVTLSACHFINDVYSSFLAPLLPLLIAKFSMTLTQAGLLSTTMQIPALLNPLLGVLADRTNVRYFIILAPAATAIPMSLLGLAPAYGILLLLLFITGVSVAAFHVPAPVMVAHLSGSSKGKGMSFFMAGGEMARTIGPMIAVAAVSVTGLEGFYPIMIFGILASIWLYFKFRDVPIHTKTAAKVSLFSTFHDMRHILLPLTGILIARGFMHASMTAFLPTFIQQETGNIWLAGSSLAALEGVGVAGVLSSGILSDRFGRRNIILLALISAPIALFLFVNTSGWIRLIMLLLTGFTLLSTTPVMLAMIQEHAAVNPSAANGWFVMMSFLARSGIVFIVGMMGDYMGLRATYSLSAVLGLGAIPFILMLPKRQ